MKRPDRFAPPPAPQRPERDPLLRQQQRDFTDEGSPPPGRVGRQTPRREPQADDEPPSDRPPPRR